MNLKLTFVALFLLSATPFLSNCSAVIVVDQLTGTQVGTDGTELTIGQWNILVGASLLADPTHDANNGFSGFDSSAIGTDSYMGNWSFAYAPVTDAISGVSLTLGIYDHDSAAAGDQVASFTVDGVDVTAELNTVMNASGGRVFPTIAPFFADYNVYTVALPASTFANIADGNVAFALQMQNGFAAGPGTFTNNNAAVDFSRLQINAVPEPGLASVFFLSTVGMACIRRRRR